MKTNMTSPRIDVKFMSDVGADDNVHGGVRLDDDGLVELFFVIDDNVHRFALHPDLAKEYARAIDSITARAA